MSEKYCYLISEHISVSPPHLLAILQNTENSSDFFRLNQITFGFRGEEKGKKAISEIARPS